MRIKAIFIIGLMLIAPLCEAQNKSLLYQPGRGLIWRYQGGGDVPPSWTNPNARTNAWAMQTTNATQYLDLMGVYNLTQEPTTFIQGIAGTNQNGRVSYYAHLDGNNNFWVSDSMATIVNPYTITLWYRSSITSGTYQYLFDCATGRIVLGNVDSSGNFSLYDGGLGVTKDFCTLTLISSNVWHHLAFVFQATNCLFYIDGIYYSQTAFAGTDLGGKTRIAKNNVGTGCRLACDIAKFNIYPSALSSNSVYTEWLNTKYPTNDIETGF